MHKRDIVSVPILGRLTVFAYRFLLLLREAAQRSVRFSLDGVRWLFGSQEYTNYTYEITAESRNNIASAISVALNVEIETVLSYFDEAEKDAALQSHIAAVTAQSPHRAITDLPAKFGRRIGWYAIARIQKPKIVVETGVDKGMGSCLMTAALERNAAEGRPGYYYGTDINPYAGFLLAGRYKSFGEILYGDSITSLEKLASPVDLFINDSDHSATYEYEEYRVIEKKLAPGAIIIGDNCNVTDKLFQFSRETGRKFLFVDDQPKNHWAGGSGVGISYLPVRN